jgi:flagellar biosynthesis protein FlhA
MLSLAAIPGLPKFSFFLLAAGTGFLAWRSPKRAAEMPGAPSPEKKAAKDSVEDLLKLDELSLEVGYGLVPLVDQSQGGQLLARVKALRQNLAQQLGFIVPPVHITDNVRLKAREYVVSLRGVEVSRWEMHQDDLMAISSEGSPRPIAGTPTKEPAFGVAAMWIPASLQNQALASGYAVVDQTSVLATHLAEVVKQHAHELLSRQEVKRLLDRLGESHPKLVEELVPKVLSLGEVQKVLQQLLREQVSIRDLPAILETLIDVAPGSRNPVVLVESVRQSLGRALVRPLLSESGGLRVVVLDHALEKELGRAFAGAVVPSGGASLQPPFARRILDGMRHLAGEQVAVATPVLLCSTPARYHLKRLLEPFLPKVVVLSPLEVPPIVEVQSVGVLR